MNNKITQSLPTCGVRSEAEGVFTQGDSFQIGGVSPMFSLLLSDEKDKEKESNITKILARSLLKKKD